MASAKTKSLERESPSESMAPGQTNSAPAVGLVPERSSGAPIALETVTSVSLKLEKFLIDVADTLNSTLEMDKLLRRVAELVRQVIDYEIFAILLLKER